MAIITGGSSGVGAASTVGWSLASDSVVTGQLVVVDADCTRGNPPSATGVAPSVPRA